MRAMTVVLGVLSVLGAGFVAAPSIVTSTAMVEGDNTVYEFTITAGQGETIKDVHILPMPKSRYRPNGDVKNNTTGTGGPWVASKGGGAFHWVATGSGLTGGQSVRLKVVAKSGFTDQPVRWVTTSDGNNEPKTGEVDHGPRSGQTPPDSATRGPTAQVSMGPVGDPPHIGTVYVMALTSDFPQVSYTISKMDAEPDDYLTDDEFEEFVLANSIPTGWNLTFNGLAGETDEDGCASASVTIPNDENLVDRSIWLVAEVSIGGGEGTIRSAPFGITFVQ